MTVNLLTGSLTPDQQAMLDHRENLIAKARAVALGIWLDEYKVGGVSLEGLCEKVHSALIRIGVPEEVRHQFIGRAIDEALARPKPKRKRGKVGHPVSLQKTIAELVDMVVEREGLAKSRDSAKTPNAFERTSEILEEAGFRVSEESVIKYYFDYRDSIG